MIEVVAYSPAMYKNTDVPVLKVMYLECCDKRVSNYEVCVMYFDRCLIAPIHPIIGVDDLHQAQTIANDLAQILSISVNITDFEVTRACVETHLLSLVERLSMVRRNAIVYKLG